MDKEIFNMILDIVLYLCIALNLYNLIRGYSFNIQMKKKYFEMGVESYDRALIEADIIGPENHLERRYAIQKIKNIANRIFI